MDNTLLANIISLIGAVIMVLIGLIKTKKNILIAQSIQFAIMGTSNIMLGGISGGISNLLGIIRNIICLKWNLTKAIKVLFILLQALLTAFFNKSGLVGWLPVPAAAAFIWFMDTTDECILKKVIIVGQLLWLVYDLYILNYTGAVFDAFSFISNIFGILILNRQQQSAVEK